MKKYTVLTLNPGSTSMKISLYRNEEKLFTTNLDIPADTIKTFSSLYDQYLYRKELVLKEMADHGYRMEDVDVYLARSGGMEPGESGVYAVNDKLMELNDLHQSDRAPQQMGCQFVKDFSETYGGTGYVINDSSVDEFVDVARVTGLKGEWRQTYAHSLNQKAAGDLAAKAAGKRYSDMNMVVAHLGGGVSIGAHRQGKLIDTSNLFGEGPMSPTRTGALPLGTLLLLIVQGKASAKELMGKVLVNGGGLLDHLGTADGREVEKRIEAGDQYAKLIYDGMIYQIGQTIARMAASLEGKVDAIVLTGGMSNSSYIQAGVKKYCEWIAPVEVFAGEYETEAMVNAALCVMSGEDTAKEYTGIPAFDSSRYTK